MSQHSNEYVQELTATLKEALRDDLYNNEHLQNRDWAMENLEKAYPNYHQSPYWPFSDACHDNNVMLESEALAAIDQVTKEILPDLLDGPAIPPGQMHQAASDAVDDFFSNTVWGEYDVNAYYEDGNGGVYSLDEYVQYLKTGQKPASERLNRAPFTG